MSLPQSRAPHTTGVSVSQPEALNAALLIDFDNVTMGMRSDLSKELKNLLNSDIIKGKVTVQRAYADWRRYPQYIVPLSENSVDLIFAPAYGSSKKNATDIRMAIDGMELVFIRPEIGTYILLTGDSDFSSLVLKLKEYGKYVIGVGIQESSSDILVQNCDEYYSYTSLTGLRKTTDSINKAADPWVLVEQAAQKMASRNDVMRSDRLKQVMIEIDPTFDEGNFGFSKFSRFLSEAASRDLVDLRKLENGQYEVRPKGQGKDDGGKDRGSAQRKPDEKSRPPQKEREERGASPRGRGRGKSEAKESGKGSERPPEGTAKEPDTVPSGADPLQAAYGLLRSALEGLAEGNGGTPVRDSDLKRKMLEMEPSFDESDLGFGKFSRFLRQAHDHEVVDLEKREEGTYQVSIRPAGGEGASGKSGTDPADSGAAASSKDAGATKEKKESDGTLPEEEFGKQVAARALVAKGLGPRRGERKGRRGKEGPPPLLEGQVVLPTGAPASQGTTPMASGKVDTGKLGLPTDPSAIVSYLTNSYKGVGKKTAESLVEAFGPELFGVLANDPDRIGTIVSGKRIEQLLEGWKVDFQRRADRLASEAQAPVKEEAKAEAKKDTKREPRKDRKPEPKKEPKEESKEKPKADLHGDREQVSPPEEEGSEVPSTEDPSPEEQVAKDPSAAIRRRTRRGGRSRRG